MARDFLEVPGGKIPPEECLKYFARAVLAGIIDDYRDLVAAGTIRGTDVLTPPDNRPIIVRGLTVTDAHCLIRIIRDERFMEILLNRAGSPLTPAAFRTRL